MKIWNFMNGSKKMSYRVSACLMMLLCSTSILRAEQQDNTDAMPSMAFLEFLGEWETEEGEWIDPFELEDDEFAALIETDNEE